jgi:hypothetical protein
MAARTIVQVATDIDQVNARIVRLEADIQTQRGKLADLVRELAQCEALARLGTRLEIEGVQDSGPAPESRPAPAPRRLSGADRDRTGTGRGRPAKRTSMPEASLDAAPVVEEQKPALPPTPRADGRGERLPSPSPSTTS